MKEKLEAAVITQTHSRDRKTFRHAVLIANFGRGKSVGRPGQFGLKRMNRG